MKEQLLEQERLERVRLEYLREGEVLTMVAGEGEDAWTYTFIVEEAGPWPQGILFGMSPDGKVSEPLNLHLQGSGNWTTREEDPVQKQPYAFTPDYDSVSVGSLFMAADNRERAVFCKPGQEISELSIDRAY